MLEWANFVRLSLGKEVAHDARIWSHTLILRKNLGFQFCAVSYNLKVVVSSPYQQLIREGNHGTTIHFGSDGAQHMFWPLGRSRILHAGA